MTHGSILATLMSYHSAMVAGDTSQLRGLTDPGFTLTHITGYVQPREEWLDVVDRGTFDYHRITLQPSTPDISISGAVARVRGRGIFDATIYGMHRPWRLAFDMTLERVQGDAWTIKRAAYRTY
jgi:hypothetical protein